MVALLGPVLSIILGDLIVT